MGKSWENHRVFMHESFVVLVHRILQENPLYNLYGNGGHTCSSNPTIEQ